MALSGSPSARAESTARPETAMEQGIDNVVPASASIRSPSLANDSKTNPSCLRNTAQHSPSTGHAAHSHSFSQQQTRPFASATSSTSINSSESLKQSLPISNVEVRQRKRGARSQQPIESSSTLDSDALPLGSTLARKKKMEEPHPKTRPSWLILALASGAFAAFNGAFAKLTTSPSIPSALLSPLAHILSLPPSSSLLTFLTLLLRAIFFTLNLLSNGIMWALFTRALTAHPSATRVSIINTSANFLITAFLGWGLFSESLPPLWFLGAGMLGVGNIILGRGKKGEKEDRIDDGDGGSEGRIKLGDDEEEEVLLVEGEGRGEWDALLEVDDVMDLDRGEALKVEEEEQ